MRDNKGWDFLTAFEDIDEKYIYQAAEAVEKKIKS